MRKCRTLRGAIIRMLILFILGLGLMITGAICYLFSMIMGDLMLKNIAILCIVGVVVDVFGIITTKVQDIPTKYFYYEEKK